ncbi:Imm53 family immunity protein [Nocardia sp. NPDC055321]
MSLSAPAGTCRRCQRIGFARPPGRLEPPESEAASIGSDRQGIVEINLAQTDLGEQKYPRQQIDRSEHDWVHAWTAERTFHLACGPRNLTEALALFRVWVSARD